MGEPDAGNGNGAGLEGTRLDTNTDASTGSGSGTGAAPGDACTIRTGPQPAGCDYGLVCGFGGICQPVPTPLCENFRNSSYTWDPATSSGPIIYAIEQVSFSPDTTYCDVSAPMRVRVRLQAYSPSGGLPRTPSELGSVLRFVRVNGSLVATTGLTSNVVTSEDQKNTEFQVSLCVTSTQTTASLGFFFQGGNGVCFLARR